LGHVDACGILVGVLLRSEFIDLRWFEVGVGVRLRVSGGGDGGIFGVLGDGMVEMGILCFVWG